jgi:hypothetical protein
MNSGLVVVAFASVILASGCATDQRALTKERTIRDLWGLASDATYLRVRGVGAVPPGITDQTRRRGLSRNAGLVSARYEMSVLLRGVRTTGGLTVASLVEKESRIKERMDQVISGAEEELVEFTRDDGAVVLLRIARSAVDDMLRSATNAEAIAVDRASLEEQLRLADGRSKEMRAKLPGMDQ